MVAIFGYLLHAWLHVLNSCIIPLPIIPRAIHLSLHPSIRTPKCFSEYWAKERSFREPNNRWSNPLNMNHQFISNGKANAIPEYGGICPPVRFSPAGLWVLIVSSPTLRSCSKVLCWWGSATPPHTHTYRHTQTCRNTQANIHRDTHTHEHTQTHTHEHTQTHKTETRSHTHTYTNTRTHTHKHTALQLNCNNAHSSCGICWYVYNCIWTK